MIFLRSAVELVIDGVKPTCRSQRWGAKKETAMVDQASLPPYLRAWSNEHVLFQFLLLCRACPKPTRTSQLAIPKRTDASVVRLGTRPTSAPNSSITPYTGFQHTKSR